VDKLAALAAHGAGHAHLRLSLRRQHDEDHEDEEDASGDGEEAHHQEHGSHDVAHELSQLHGVLLHLLHAQVGIGEGGLHLLCHRIGEGHRVAYAAAVGDADEVDFTLAVEEPLGHIQASDHALQGAFVALAADGARRDFVLDDVHDLEGVGNSGDENLKGIAWLGVKLLLSALVEVDLVGGEGTDVEHLAVK